MGKKTESDGELFPVRFCGSASALRPEGPLPKCATARMSRLQWLEPLI